MLSWRSSKRLLKRALGASRLAAASILACAGMLLAVQAQAAEEVTIGIIGSNELGVRASIVTPTLNHLIRTLPQYRFRTIDIPIPQAVDLVKRTRPDFIVGPADIFFTLINTAGAQAIATRKNI